MISFVLNKEVIHTDAKTGMSLLHFIREERRLKGTKAGCKEGDCGACTVLIGELKHAEVLYHSVTSCLTPLGAAQGKHVVTIEGINLINKLNIVQETLRVHHGTQCGFCSPGIVVSLTGHTLNERNSNESFRDSMSGNICRCTGYKAIENAGIHLDAQIAENGSDIGLKTLITGQVIPDYFEHIPELLKTLDKSITIEDNYIIGGGTDLYVREADNFLNRNVCLGNDRISRHILIDGNKCDIGLGTTVSDLWSNVDLNSAFPDLKKHLKFISSEQIRNMATIGGNFVNASPIADLAIIFLALDASLLIENRMGKTRRIELKDFFQNYKVIDLGEDEVLQSLKFQMPSGSHFFNFEKVSKRTHLDIASVNTAMFLMVADDTILDCHLSIGGVAPIPLYLKETCNALRGQPLSVKSVILALKVLLKEINPISDVRGSSKYKKLLARQLFFAHFLEMFPSLFTLKNLRQ